MEELLNTVSLFLQIVEVERMLRSKHIEKKFVDTRYNVPKGGPVTEVDVIDTTIASNDIYSRVREGMLNAQRKQVGYGLDKYPEPLNANTWTTVETIDHIIDETIDKLHYLTMLRIKLVDEATSMCVDPQSSLGGVDIDGVITEIVL